MHSTLRPLFLILAIVVLTAACTTSSGTSAAPSVAAPSAAAPSEAAPPEAAPSEAAPSEPAASAATGDATIALTTNDLGTMIVDADGKSLYAFTPDSAGTSTCYDDCATNWPPLLADDPAAISAGEGLDATKLTTTDRTDGTKQVKYGDWPLYYFAGDAAAGDTKGQGVGTIWYVVDATGALIGQ
jgi:predicted lipoprotein with Yx(FWY)xxD motif